MSFIKKSLKVSLLTFISFMISIPCLSQEQTQNNPITADAGAVYFIRNDNIWIFDLKTSQERQIIHDKKITSYCVSSDSRLLAYFVEAEKLYLYDLKDQKETFLANIKSDLTNPAFSPKADQIVLIGYADWTRHVWLLDVKTKKLTDLTAESPYHHIHANWSPDGKWISFAAFINPWWTFFVDTDWEVYVLDALIKNPAPKKIGKGSQSQWADKNTLVIAREKSISVYNMQPRTLSKEYKTDGHVGNFTIGNTREIIFHTLYPGGEGVKKIARYDLTSQKRLELIINAENPTYVKASQ